MQLLKMTVFPSLQAPWSLVSIHHLVSKMLWSSTLAEAVQGSWVSLCSLSLCPEPAWAGPTCMATEGSQVVSLRWPCSSPGF